MSDFEFFQVNNETYNDYILMVTTDDIYFMYNEIYDVLSKNMGSDFKIIVDLFLRNGFTFNRFSMLEFVEGKVKTVILNPREVPEIIKETTKKFLRNNPRVLQQSALSKTTINFVLTN